MLSKLHGLLVKIGTFLQCPLLLVIRLYWGWQFFITGKAKLQNLDQFAVRFHNWGIPHAKLNVILAGSTECVCGLLLLLGLCSRFATLALACVMCVAFWKADPDAVRSIFSDPDQFVSATPFLFLYAAVIVFAFGPGRISLDALIFREKKA